MGILVHKGWTNVDLSWNQLWANLPKTFEPFLEIWECPILSQGAHFWPKNLLFLCYTHTTHPTFFNHFFNLELAPPVYLLHNCTVTTCTL